ncbi:MAG: tetratricopeptide repeat protein [Phaeodactylibacter sp.]|uniref:tetratricopeptide repeat protein n=1 Tax=Phaeodactylibacter sp. TaxID=1940289 RepID=UPI0032ED14B3
MEESKRIDEYLSDQLSAADQQAFEEELNRDPELRRQVDLQRDMAFLLSHQKDRAALKAQMEQTGADFFAEAPSSRPKARIRWIGWAATAAAAAILLFVLWPVFVQPDLYQQYAEFPPLALSEKGTATTNWAATEQTFNTGDYTEAVEQLEDYLQAFPNDQQARLYLGISRMETGQLTNARLLFAIVATKAPGLSDYAQWYTALSYLKEGDKEAARSVLEQIEAGTTFYGQAQEVLGALE